MGPGTEPEQAEEEAVVQVQFPTLLWHQEVLRLREDPICKYIYMLGGVLTAKTSFGSCLLLDLMERMPGKLIWWIAGLGFQLEAFWEEFKPRAELAGIKCKDKPWPRATHWNGCRVMAVTAQNPENIAAHHPHFIIGDEWAKWRPSTYDLVRVRMARGCPGFFFSSPRPAEHVLKVVDQTKKRLDPKARFWPKTWRSEDGRGAYLHVTTPEAGIADEAEIEALRGDLSQTLFAQEIMGELVAAGGSVFRNVDACATGDVLKPKAREDGKPPERYVIGWDPAATQDWSVYAVRKVRTDQVVKMGRMQRLSYHAQSRILVDEAYRYHKAPIVFDATAAQGQMIQEILEATAFQDGRHPDIVPVVFDNLLKGLMVENLSVRFEQKRIVIPSRQHGEPYATAIRELVSFEKARTVRGLTYTYQAPPGEHDDCVSAIMLAFYGETDAPGLTRLGPEPSEEKRRARANALPAMIRRLRPGVRPLGR